MSGGDVVAIIPARGGSKRLPGKNLLPFRGLPLIGWTIRAAREARSIDRLILSSDDPDIMDVAQRLGCEAPFRRPDRLATDEATTVDVVLHAVGTLEKKPSIVVILQPTSPLRLPADIDAAVAMLRSSGAVSCIGVTRLAKPMDFHAWLSPADGGLQRGAVFAHAPGRTPVVINGAIYACDCPILMRSGKIYGERNVALEIPFERSIDIDTSEDFALAEALWPLSWGRLG